MGLPKNFQQTVNLNKRVEALNDLTFFNFKYEIVLSKKTINEVYDNNKNFNDLEEFFGKMEFIGNKKAKCTNRVSAINPTIAENKIKEWLDKMVDSEVIERYTIYDVEEKTFKEELEDKKLLDILNFKRD